MNQGFERGGGQPGFHFFQVMEARRAPHAQSVKQGQEGLRARFVRHLARGELAQFIVNRRQQVILSLGIADLGGINASHDAWLATLHGKSAPGQDGLTGEQQFFLSNAITNRFKARDAALRRQILTNEHAPSQYRALEGRNVDAWYAAFDVKPGDKLYLAPDARVKIW